MTFDQTPPSWIAWKENKGKIRIDYKNHVDGKWYFIGDFDTHEEAQKAYHQAVLDIKSGYSHIYLNLC